MNAALEKKAISQGKWITGLGLGFCVAALMLAVAVWLKQRAVAEEQAAHARNAVEQGPLINGVQAQLSDPDLMLELPGEVRAYYHATLYAKISGYLKTIRVNIGDRVRAGQVIATIEAPEVAQQVASAQADVTLKAQAIERNKQLVQHGLLSQEQMQEAEAQHAVAQANLARIRALQDYQNVRAPFAGRITARYADPGALLPAPISSTQGALPLVDIDDTEKVRVVVHVGQLDAKATHVGDQVELWTDEAPQEVMQASVTHIANALDPNTRTSPVEIVVDNRDRKLLAGTFVHVRIRLQVTPYPTVPLSALVHKQGKTWVGVIREGKLFFSPITIARQDGVNMQVTSGLAVGDQVALNVSSNLETGSRVRAVMRK